MTEQDYAGLVESIRLTRNMKWVSTDKDNMEFECYASVYQKEAVEKLAATVQSLIAKLEQSIRAEGEALQRLRYSHQDFAKIAARAEAKLSRTVTVEEVAREIGESFGINDNECITITQKTAQLLSERAARDVLSHLGLKPDD
jgi:hypothetical protein